jgi:hypothetical protein
MRIFLPLLPFLAASAANGQAPAFEVTSVKFNKLPPRERHVIQEDECGLLVQSLLADRFKLAVHREQRELPAYSLGRDPLRGWSMQQLADMLTGQPALDGRPVLDRTGLDGTYEIDLNYAFVPGVVNADAPEIFDAVQEQLGLKLESVKAQFETLAVDRLEKPDAN